MNRYALLAATFAIMTIALSCAEPESSNTKPNHAILGTKAPAQQMLFDTTSIVAKPILRKFTFINVGDPLASFGGTLPKNKPAEGEKSFGEISAYYTTNSDGSPTRVFSMSRSFAELKKFNSDQPCDLAAKELSEVTDQLPSAVLICESEFASALEHGQEVRIDGRQFTNWSVKTKEFPNFVATIHNF